MPSIEEKEIAEVIRKQAARVARRVENEVYTAMVNSNETYQLAARIATAERELAEMRETLSRSL